MRTLDRYALSIGAAAAFVVLTLTAAGCGQHATGALPEPSLVQPMNANRARGATLSPNLKVHFPTPIYFGQGNPIEDLAPSVSMMTPSKVVEENTKNGKLVYRVGNVGDINSVAWGPSVPIGDGGHPSLATDGVSTVVDVHSDGGRLLYRVGKLAKESIDWGSASPYETGVKPHAALSGTSSLVEVHDGGNGYVYSMVGQVDPVKQTINFGSAVDYDAGHDPSVAANANGDVIELHSGSQFYGYSHLYYHVGKIDSKSKKVDWGKTSVEVPGTFSSPSSIAWSAQGYIVIAYVCEGAKPFNFYYLCTTMGSLGSDKTITWYGKARSYLGDFPTTISLALNGNWAVAATSYPSLVEYTPSIMKYSTSLLSDRSNWERDHLEGALNGKTLHQIVFPASHDSGMYADVFGGIYAEALAQDENLHGQLDGGQRYLDLRPDNYDGDLHFYHGLETAPIEGPLVQDGLNDVAKYMKEGHREVVILEILALRFRRSL